MPSVGIKQDPKVIAWARQTYIDEPSILTEDLPPTVATSLASVCQRLVPSLQPSRRASEIVSFELPFRTTLGSDEDGEYVRIIRDLHVPCVYGKKGELQMPLKKLRKDDGTEDEPETAYMYTPRRQITHLYKYHPKTGMASVRLPEYMLLLALFHCRTKISNHYLDTGSAKEIRDRIRRDWTRCLKGSEWKTVEIHKTKDKQECSAEDKKAISKMRKWEWPKDPLNNNKIESVDSRKGHSERSTGVETTGLQEERHGNTSGMTEDNELEIDWKARERYVESILIFRTQENELLELHSRPSPLDRKKSILNQIRSMVTVVRPDEDESTREDRPRRFGKIRRFFRHGRRVQSS